MGLALNYGNTQSVAHAVLSEMAGRGIAPLMPLPYNRFDKMDSSTWWVSPSKQNPAFKYGKYAFVPELAKTADIFCGLHVEKGFGPTVAPVVSSASVKRMLMQPDWLWHRFVADIAAGKLDEPVNAVAAATGEPVRLIAQAYYCKTFDSDGGFDPYETGDDWDQVEFHVGGKNLSLDASGSRTPSGLLKEVSRSTLLSEVGKSLRVVPNQEWVWMNVWIGCDLLLDAKAEGAWPAAECYDRLLKPMRPWFA